MKIFFNAVLYDILLNTISRNIEVPFRGAELGDFFWLDETTEVVCRRILLTNRRIQRIQAFKLAASLGKPLSSPYVKLIRFYFNQLFPIGAISHSISASSVRTLRLASNDATAYQCCIRYSCVPTFTPRITEIVSEKCTARKVAERLLVTLSFP